ncbi:MAG TPA: group II intron reverse transcriptase/maturase [Longimicrobium sp.]|nr:group II intron reverse transcriptase/maturase [Longimicrobium sp.]
MYVAPRSDKDWLLNEQRKLYARSRENPDYVFHKLWGLVTDERNLRIAVARVARNRGRRTPGVDGLTVRNVIDNGVTAFVGHVRAELRSGAYRPRPVRRVLIPKPGQPGKFRGLGIPTVRDRVVQAALKNILEPVFEADFYPTSHGFRPGKSAHGALEHLRLLLRPREAGPEAQRRLTYQWAIEGDIKACFDNIDHHALMVRLRRRVGDPKVSRLVLAFLKSGILSEEQFTRSDAGTPQGGILSPLLANIALAVLDERYSRYAWPRRTPDGHTGRAMKPLSDAQEIVARGKSLRMKDLRRRGIPIAYPTRYADDFIILVGAPTGPDQFEQAHQAALKEKEVVAALLRRELGLELSETKTLITPVTEPMRFLGHHVRVRRHPVNGNLVVATLIPKDASHRLREKVKDLFRRRTTADSLANRLRALNPLLAGWSNFYRHAWGAKLVFASLDFYVWWTITRWLRKKHRRASWAAIVRRYGRRWPRGGLSWEDEAISPFRMARRRVKPFRLCWLKTPDFASSTHGEPDA